MSGVSVSICNSGGTAEIPSSLMWMKDFLFNIDQRQRTKDKGIFPGHRSFVLGRNKEARHEQSEQIHILEAGSFACGPPRLFCQLR